MRPRLRAVLERDAGFTLAELTVALMLAVIMMMTVAVTLKISGNLQISDTGSVSSPFPGSERIPVVAGWGEL